MKRAAWDLFVVLVLLMSASCSTRQNGAGDRPDRCRERGLDWRRYPRQAGYICRKTDSPENRQCNGGVTDFRLHPVGRTTIWPIRNGVKTIPVHCDSLLHRLSGSRTVGLSAVTIGSGSSTVHEISGRRFILI